MFTYGIIIEKKGNIIMNINFDKIKEDYFNIEGRINRKVYIMRFLTLMVISFIIGLIFGLLGSNNGLVNVIISLVLAIAAFSQHIKRLHDLGKSAWWCLLMLIPIVNLGLIIYLVFFKGDEFTNEYGINPLANDNSF